MIQAIQQQIDKVLERPHNSWFEYLRRFLGRFILSNITPGAGYLGVWARDAAFILYGWLALGEYERGLNACSEIWGHRIRESSLIVAGRSRNTFVPSKIADREFKKRFQGMLPTTILKGCLEVYGAEPDIDSTALMIDVTCKLLRRADSSTKRSELLPLVENAATALLNKDVDGDMVLEQGPNEDWMDTAYRYGKVLYSNVCWLSALRSLAEVDGKREEWYDTYNEARKAVVRTFRLDSSEPVGVVGLRAYKKHVWQDTVLAAEHVDSESIVRQLSKKLDAKIGPRVVHPQLPISSWRSRKWGTYHNGAFWPWFSSMHALALNRLGFIEESWRIMRSVVKYCLYEWVNPDNESGRGPKPFRTGCATALAVLAELHDGVE